MEAYLDDAPCLYFSTSDDGKLLHYNKRLCQKLGYTKNELEGKSVDAIFTIATRIFQQTHFFPLLKMQGFAEEIFITLLSKSNEHIPVLINAERQLKDEQPVTIYTGIIVQNRKKYEDELVAARKAAEKALNENTLLLQAKMDLQKNLELLDQEMYTVKKQNEELLQFNRVVTHDLQEPLRKLLVFNSMVIANNEKEINCRTIERMKASTEQMRSILSGLQQYVWLTEIDVKPTPINFSSLLLLVKSELEKENPGIIIKLSVEELPCVEADHEQIRLLLYEILKNAIQFRRLENEVFITVSGNRLLLNQFKSIPDKYKYTEFVKLQIKDEGVGFDATYKEQVFDLFKKLHPVSGRGVGLSLCKKIVENHHGMITVDSQAGVSTTFSIFLPLPQHGIKTADSKNEKHKNTLTKNAN